jgi:hypothetical protein
MAHEFCMVRLPWLWEERVSPNEASEGIDTVGVGRFAKDVAILAVPMSLVAGAFALYMNVKVADIKEIIRDAVNQHAASENGRFVSRIEYEAYQKMEEMRWKQIQEANNEQSVQIRKNTMLLERIANKLNIRRENGD